MLDNTFSSTKMDLMVFSKHLVGPPLDEVARRLQALGIQKIDLTVRPGGHVEPAEVRNALPAAAELLATHDVKIGMITTGITRADEPHTEAVLHTAAELGIQYYKLGYYMYEGFGTLRKSRDEARAKLADLAQLNAQVGIRAGYHNHADIFIGASLGDIDYLLENTDPRFVGLYFDPTHAVIEGGSAAWEMGLDLLRERVLMLAVKDFKWVDAGKGYAGGRRHSIHVCPLQDGNVPWPRVLHHLREIGFNGPVSLHSEYQGHASFRDLSTDEVFDQTAQDVEVLREWMR